MFNTGIISARALSGEKNARTTVAERGTLGNVPRAKAIGMERGVTECGGAFIDRWLRGARRLGLRGTAISCQHDLRPSYTLLRRYPRGVCCFSRRNPTHVSHLQRHAMFSIYATPGKAYSARSLFLCIVTCEHRKFLFSITLVLK